MLGGALLGQKKYSDAEPLLRPAYEGLKQREKTIPPQANTRLPEALDRLIDPALEKKGNQIPYRAGCVLDIIQSVVCCREGLRTTIDWGVKMNERERNLRIAQEVHRDFAWNGQSFQKGDFVALLDGQIVAVKNNADDTIAALRALDSDPNRGMVVEVSPPVVDVIRRVQ